MPLQSRSRASLTRMLAAAQRLLIERGSSNFTLSDVSRVGRVSIGSIYHRFQSKDELLRAVHRDFMEEMESEQSRIIERARAESRDLRTLLAVLVDEIAEFLKRHAPPLRPMMACADQDEAIRNAGKLSLFDLMTRFVEAVAAYRAEIRHDDPEEAARVCFKIIYGGIARDLGLEALHTATTAAEWPVLKANLFAMSLSYLTAPPATTFREALRNAQAAHATPARRGKAAKA